MSRDQKRQLKRLLLIQAGVTIGRIIQSQILVRQPFAPTHTLCDRIPRQLQMDAPKLASFFLVDTECGRELVEDRAELAGFVARRGATGIAMHRVALPDGEVAAGADGANVSGEERGDFVLAVAGD